MNKNQLSRNTFSSLTPTREGLKKMEQTEETLFNDLYSFNTGPIHASRDAFEGKVVREVRHENDKLTICYDDGVFTLTAFGECCSTSVIVFPCLNNWVIDDELRGESIELIWRQRNDAIVLPRHNSKACVTDQLYAIECKSGKSFHFAVRNHSNGYYVGYLVGHWASLAVPLRVYYWTNTKIVMVVGLPGAGKTTFAVAKWGESPNKTVYDDEDLVDQIHTTEYFNRHAETTEKSTVCFVSALFTDLACYDAFLRDIGRPPRSQIRTYCFLPDVEQSIINKKERETDIRRMSEVYCPYADDYINVIHLATFRK